MSHMDDGRLQAWLDADRAGLAEAERAEITAHLAACDECARRVEELRASTAAADALLAALEEPVEELPDFAAVRARADELKREAPTRARRRLPLGWAAGLVVAVGVGWMANEIARENPGAVAPEEADSLGPVRAVAPEEAGPLGPAEAIEIPGPPRVEPGAGSGVVPRSEGEARDLTPPPAPVPAAASGEVAQADAADSPAAPAPELAARARSEPGDVAVQARRDPAGAEAPAATPSPTATDAPATTLTGRVTDATSGRPLESAQVWDPVSGAGTLTDEDGRFALTLASGLDSTALERPLRVELIGYTGTERTVRLTGGELSLPEVAMQSTALRLQELVTTGAADRGAPPAATVDPTATGVEWRLLADGATPEELDFAPLDIPSLERLSSALATVGGVAVLRSDYRLVGGGVLRVHQATTPLMPAGADDFAVRRVGEVWLMGVAPVDRESLAELLGRAR